MTQNSEDYIPEILDQMINSQNARLSGCGWRESELGADKKYTKHTPSSSISIDLPGYSDSDPISKELFQLRGVEEGHVGSFSIWYDIHTVYILGGGNHYFAEVHEPSGEPGYVDERPMTKDELRKFCQRISTELRDFEKIKGGCLSFMYLSLGSIDMRKRKLKRTIRKDLKAQFDKALETLPQDWERYRLKQEAHQEE